MAWPFNPRKDPIGKIQVSRGCVQLVDEDTAIESYPPVMLQETMETV